MNATAGKPLALVTGASSGIGLELARQFALHGYDLVICADDAAKLRTAGQEIAASTRLAPRIESVTADLSTPQGVEQLWSAVQALGRPLDVLAANAGIGAGGAFARDTDLQQELRIVNLNCASQVHLTKLAVRDMVARGGGKVLITSSIASQMPGAYEAVYAASKAFLQSFGKAIREELKDTGVTVTLLMPGPTDTEFFDRAGMQDTKVGQSESKDDPADVAEAAYEALEKGEASIATGARTKLQAGLAKVLPDALTSKAHGAQAKPRH